MFGLFNNKKKEIVSNDFIWKNEIVKYNALIKHLQQMEKSVLIYYFEDTKAEAERIYYLYREYLFLKIAGLVNFYVNIDRGHGLKPDLDKYLQYISKTESDKNK